MDIERKEVQAKRIEKYSITSQKKFPNLKKETVIQVQKILGHSKEKIKNYTKKSMKQKIWFTEKINKIDKILNQSE
jgi:hypothetical protein